MGDKGNVAREYKRKQIETASPGELIVLLYDGAIEYLKRAEEALGEEGPDRIEKFHSWLIRSQNIITELMVSLDMDRGGEIASNLFRLYEYMNNQLVQANMQKKIEPVVEVRELMMTLRAAWYEVKDIKPQGGNSAPGSDAGSGLNIQG